MDRESEKAASDARVWVFHGDQAGFAAGVFASQAQALARAARHKVTGILTEYPVGEGCYDFNMRQGRFRPSKPHHGTAAHVACFSPNLGHVHVHVVDGEPD